MKLDIGNCKDSYVKVQNSATLDAMRQYEKAGQTGLYRYFYAAAGLGAPRAASGGTAAALAST